MLIHVKLWRVEVFGAKSPGPRSNVLRKSMGIKTVLFGTTLLLFSKPPSFFPWKGRTLSRVKSSTINIFFSLVGTHLHRNSKFTNSLKSLSCRSLYFCFTGDIVAFRWCNYVNWCWNRQMSFSLESVLTGNFFLSDLNSECFFYYYYWWQTYLKQSIQFAPEDSTTPFHIINRRGMCNIKN